MKHAYAINTEDCIIRYTTSDNQIIDIDNYTLGVTIISHTYEEEGVIISDSPITRIPAYAFSRRSTLVSITIPESVKNFYHTSFWACSSLKEFNHSCASKDKRCLICNGILKVFAPANITEYTIPNGIVKIGTSAFAGSKIKKITIPNGVQIIGDCAFQHCKYLEEVLVSEGVTEIGRSAFSNCIHLKSIGIPSSVTGVGDWAFVGCKSLKEFNSNLASLDKRCLILNGELVAFASSGIEEYTFPVEITSSKTTVFDYNNKLKKVQKELKKTLEQRSRDISTTRLNNKYNYRLSNATEIIAITRSGNINRTPKREFTTQTIGSKGIQKGYYSDGIKTIVEASLNDTLLIFTESGHCYKSKVIDVPSTKFSKTEVKVKELIGITEDEPCVVLPVNLVCDKIEDYYVLITSNYGACVRHKLSDYISLNNGRTILWLREKDEKIVSASLAFKQDIITHYSVDGFSNAFGLEEIRTTSQKSASCGVRINTTELSYLGASPFWGLSHIIATKSGFINRIEFTKTSRRGVRGIKMIKLKEGDSLVFGQMFNGDDDILIATLKGFIFRTNISQFEIQQRCKRNIKCINLSENDEVVACCKFSPYNELVVDINRDRLNEYQQETDKSQSLLSNIFVDDEENEVKPVITSIDIASEMLGIIFTKGVWQKGELEAICKNKGLILGAVLEEINDYSYSKIDDAVVEESGDNIYVALEYKEDIL